MCEGRAVGITKRYAGRYSFFTEDSVLKCFHMFRGVKFNALVEEPAAAVSVLQNLPIFARRASENSTPTRPRQGSLALRCASSKSGGFITGNRRNMKQKANEF